MTIEESKLINFAVTMRNVREICVFAASSPRVDEKYMNAAYELGREIALHGVVCVNGAGREGLMHAVSDGALDACGCTIGIIPEFMVDNGWEYDRMTEIIITKDMHSRKKAMIERSDAIVALPGGCGTLEELLEVITWKQLGLYKGAVVICNIDGFYDSLLGMFDRCIHDSFMKESHARLWHVITKPGELFEVLDKINIVADNNIESKY